MLSSTLQVLHHFFGSHSGPRLRTCYFLFDLILEGLQIHAAVRNSLKNGFHKLL